MNIRSFAKVSNAAGDVVCPAGEVVAREAIPSDDANLALWVEQGVMEYTDDPVTWPAPAPLDDDTED